MKHAFVAKAKDPEKDGIPCYNDSGSPLFVKYGKRHVQIGMKRIKYKNKKKKKYSRLSLSYEVRSES